MHPLTLIMYWEPISFASIPQFFSIFHSSDADVKVDFPSMINLEPKVKIDLMSAALVAKILSLTRIHVHA